MRPPSVRFKREIVSVAFLVAFVALYLPFEHEPWSIYVALCTSYTILVFGLLWSDGKWQRYIAAGQRKARELAQGHAVFLLILTLWIWICEISRPSLPDWMFDEIYRGLTYHLIFSGLGIVALWWAEQSWLAKPPKRTERFGNSVE